MDFLVEQLKFLGLNAREIKVFTALSAFGRLNMTKLAGRSGLPRTTVDAIIRRLVEQGLVTTEQVRGHTEYSIRLHDVADRLDWIEQRLRPQQSVCAPEDVVQTASNIPLAIRECETPKDVHEAFRLHEGERVRLLLARSSGGVHRCIERLSEYVRFAVQYNLKLEILACSFVADTLRSSAGQLALPKEPDMIRLNIVPLSYCSSASDALIFRDVAVLVHVEHGTVVCVEQPDTVEMMKHLLDIACETGWSVNLAAWLEEV